MLNFLRSDSRASSMRLGFIMISVGVLIVILSVAFYIIKFSMQGKEIVNWDSMGIFLVGLASIFTGAAWQKAQQKKNENV